MPWWLIHGSPWQRNSSVLTQTRAGEHAILSINLASVNSSRDHTSLGKITRCGNLSPPTQCSPSSSFSSPPSHTCPVNELIQTLSSHTLTAPQIYSSSPGSSLNSRLIYLTISLHLHPGVYTAPQSQCALNASCSRSLPSSASGRTMLP